MRAGKRSVFGVQGSGGGATHRAAARRAAFTLVEMMLVIALAATLMALLASSLLQARNAARRAKAEAELREMVNALIEYFNTYGQWPPGAEGKEIDMTEAFLQPLINPEHASNPLGVVFLNKTFTEVERTRSTKKYGESYYLDPWQRPYRMEFESKDLTDNDVANRTKHTVSVWFPNKSRRW